MSSFLNVVSSLLCTQLWQVTALIVIVLLLSMTVLRRRPHYAYAIWLLVLVKCVTPPVWSSPVGVFSWLGREEVATVSPLPVMQNRASLNISGDSKAFVSSVTEASPETVTTVTPSSFEPRHYFFTFWMAGCLFSFAWTLVKHIRGCYSLRKLLLPEEPVDITARVERLKNRLSVQNDVRVRVVSKHIGPAVYGFMRPTIIIPRSVVEQCDADELDLILGHELIHLRRRDAWHVLLQTLVGIVWWFHPLVWWMQYRIAEQREQCCDAELIACTSSDPEQYANCLLKVIRQSREPHLIGGLPFIPLRQNKERLKMIMQSHGRAIERTPGRIWLLTAGLSIILLPGAALVQAEPKDATPVSEESAKPGKPVKEPVPLFPEVAKERSRRKGQLDQSFKLTLRAGQTVEEAIRSIASEIGVAPTIEGEDSMIFDLVYGIPLKQDLLLDCNSFQEGLDELSHSLLAGAHVKPTSEMALLRTYHVGIGREACIVTNPLIRMRTPHKKRVAVYDVADLVKKETDDDTRNSGTFSYEGVQDLIMRRVPAYWERSGRFDDVDKNVWDPIRERQIPLVEHPELEPFVSSMSELDSTLTLIIRGSESLHMEIAAALETMRNEQGSSR
ncbi:MAG: hypothetical protein CMJ46_03460 [Planctomyces sp.]|nr:hypothetical protein [Planctomyces sp.]